MLNKLKLKAGSGSTPGRFWLNRKNTISGLILVTAILGSCASVKTIPLPERSQPPPTTRSTYLQYTNPKEFYEITLEHAKINPAPSPATSGTIWGVTVPHHLLAADLTASALKQVARPGMEGTGYKNIFILSPDHYDHGKTVITIANQPLKTTVGESTVNTKIISLLAKLKNTRINNEIFPGEHGISAILPFVRILWPKAQTIAILIRSDATKEDLAELIPFLQEQISIPGTLIIESSDFSHYLTADEAKIKDTETINALKSNDPDKIWTLNQPDNCDSLNILYIMKKLQQNSKSGINILVNKNSQDYIKEKIRETTSYITIIFNTDS